MFTFNPYAFIDIKNKICHLAILNTEAIYLFFSSRRFTYSIDYVIFLPKVRKVRRHLMFDLFEFDRNKYDEAIKQFLNSRKENSVKLNEILFLRMFQTSNTTFKLVADSN